MQSVIWVMVVVGVVVGVEPNYEDLDLVADQARGEKVDVNQEDPHSNNIHVAHNNPQDSDISIVQSNPFNTTIHISLNVGKGCKTKVTITNARNLQLHVSYNGMVNSEAVIEIEKAFNSTVHLAFQNPRNTPVTVKMNEAKISSLHVSQNIPQKSPMEVTMENAADNQIHLSQSVPMSSPLTWKLTGDIESNQIEVSQNAADSASPLSCSPECPQEEYVYDYQYAGSAGHNNVEDDVVVVDDAVESKVVPVDPIPAPDYPEETNYISDYTTDYQEYSDYNTAEEYSDHNTVEEDSEYNTVADYDYTDQASDVAVPGGDGDVDGDAGGGVGGVGGGGVVCPGGDLYTCIDVCPGQFGARVFGLCVATCGRRCP